MTRSLRLTALLCLFRVSSAAAADVTVNVVNMIPAALSSESNQDSEPFLAVDTANDKRMIASALTPNPFGPSSLSAPVFVTGDAGATWMLENILPLTDAYTCDATVAIATRQPTVYASFVRRPCPYFLHFVTASTNDAAAQSVMTVLAERHHSDQPFVLVSRAQAGRIVVGHNNLDALDSRTASVDWSDNNGQSWTTAVLEHRDVGTGDQDGPAVRLAEADDGTLYAAYYGWRKQSQAQSGKDVVGDVVVVRQDPTPPGGALSFAALVDADGKIGVRVARDVSVGWEHAIGQERVGSLLSLAVHPQYRDVAYVAWASLASGVYTLHVNATNDGGRTWSSDLVHRPNVATAALAVSRDGTVALLLQQVARGRWRTVLLQTMDSFTTIVETVLANTDAMVPRRAFDPYLGDFISLVAVGAGFCGVFSASNLPDAANFPNGVTYQRNADFRTKRLLSEAGNDVAISIDPFFVRASSIKHP
jgi:hypothetical protein